MAQGTLARVWSLDGIKQFIDVYAQHGPRDAPYTPSIGDRGFMDYADAVAEDALGNVAMALLNTPLEVETKVEAALP